jgi:hypothetical protein
MKQSPRFLVILCICFALAAGSCCREKTITLIGLSADAKLYIPYTNGGTVRFVHNSDTIVTTINIFTDSVEVNCEGDCCDRLFQGSYNVTAKKPTGETFIELSTYDNTISFSYNNSRFADLVIDKTSKLAVTDSLKGSFYYDSLSVNNVLHYRVYKLLRFYQQGDAKQLFYSKERGVLRVEYENGDVYRAL